MLNAKVDEDKVGARSEGLDLLGRADKSQHVAEQSPDTGGPDGWGDVLGLDGGSEDGGPCPRTPPPSSKCRPLTRACRSWTSSRQSLQLLCPIWVGGQSGSRGVCRERTALSSARIRRATQLLSGNLPALPTARSVADTAAGQMLQQAAPRRQPREHWVQWGRGTQRATIQGFQSCDG